MSEWASYTLSDFLMFSARTYFRLIDLYNVAVWPLQLLAVAAGIAVVVLAQRGGERLAAAVMGVCWLWVAWAFHVERYATINSAALYFAAGFAVQGVLLIALGRVRMLFGRAGFGIMLAVLLGYPLLALADGRPWMQGEVFGIAPDATVAFTLAVLAFSTRAHWTLWPIPLAWSAISGATLWTMKVAQFWILPLIAMLALLSTLRKPPPSEPAR